MSEINNWIGLDYVCYTRQHGIINHEATVNHRAGRWMQFCRDEDVQDIYIYILISYVWLTWYSCSACLPVGGTCRYTAIGDKVAVIIASLHRYRLEQLVFFCH